MYKNLDGEPFGITGRQNEVIELALSYGFEGINVDLNELLMRTKASGQDFATRYIDSAKVTIGGFKLPVKVTGDEETFKADLEKLREAGAIATAINAKIATYEIQPATDGIAYQENFDLHCDRLRQVADVLKDFDIKLGLSINATSKRREGKDSEFIYQAEPMMTLIKSIGHPNVGLALDLWHWLIGGGTIEQVRDIVDQIVSVRIADLPEEYDADSITGDQRLLPGTTENKHCAELIKILHEKNYDGPVTPGQSASALKRMPKDSMVQKCRNALDAILIEVGVIEPPPIPDPVKAEEGDAEESKSEETGTEAEAEGAETAEAATETAEAEA